MTLTESKVVQAAQCLLAAGDLDGCGGSGSVQRNWHCACWQVQVEGVGGGVVGVFVEGGEVVWWLGAGRA